MFALLTAAHSSYVLQPSAMAPMARSTPRSAPPAMFWGSIAAADIVGIDARKQPQPVMANNPVIEGLASVIAQAEIVGIDGGRKSTGSPTARMPKRLSDAVADAALAMRIGM
jgi:hypothetical protein